MVLDKYSNRIKILMSDKLRDEKQFNEASDKLRKSIDKLIKVLFLLLMEFIRRP